MGTHPIFESDFDCLTEWIFLFPIPVGIKARGVSPNIASKYSSVAV